MDWLVIGTEVWHLRRIFLMDQSLNLVILTLLHVFGLRGIHSGHISEWILSLGSVRNYTVLLQSLRASQPGKWFHHCCTWLLGGT